MVSRIGFSVAAIFTRQLFPIFGGGASRMMIPSLPLLTPHLISRGMKWVAHPKKRCKDCYFVVKDEVKYVMCLKHARHKQGTKRGPLKLTWIMTHATNGSAGSGHGNGRMQMWTQQGFRMDF